jgi:flagellar biosynthesis/type III secretory pathway M-ring protein FliF/YscJ
MTDLLAAAPALPLHSAGKYVAGAYIVFVALLLVYVTIMATRLARAERELAQLNEDLQAREQQEAARDLEPAA